MLPKALNLPLLQIVRAHTFEVKGSVHTKENIPCKQTQVEIVLRSSRGFEILTSALITNEQGVFNGQVTVPNDTPVADYQVFARTQNTSLCRASVSQ